MSQRYIFIDVLRGIAVLWMIQVHVTNVFLDPALRTGWVFNLLNLSNGFVAPAFIFCAGGGLWIALDRKGDAFLKFDKSFWRYLRRLALVLFWGYALHFPVFVYGSLTSLSAEQWSTGLQIDVLHTIVFSSLLAVAAFFIVRNSRRISVAMTLAAVLVSCTTVLFYTHPASSPFPIFPWSAYLFAGIGVVGWFMQSTNKNRSATILIIIGMVVPALVFLIKDAPFTSPWSELWWQTSPGSQLFRLSGIAVAFGALFKLENRLPSTSTGRLLQFMGQESLFLYVSHLLLVYSWGPTITRALFGFDTVNALGVVVIWVMVTIPLVFLIKWWRSRD